VPSLGRLSDAGWNTKGRKCNVENLQCTSIALARFATGPNMAAGAVAPSAGRTFVAFKARLNPVVATPGPTSSSNS